MFPLKEEGLQPPDIFGKSVMSVTAFTFAFPGYSHSPAWVNLTFRIWQHLHFVLNGFLAEKFGQVIPDGVGISNCLAFCPDFCQSLKIRGKMTVIDNFAYTSWN